MDDNDKEDTCSYADAHRILDNLLWLLKSKDGLLALNTLAESIRETIRSREGSTEPVQAAQPEEPVKPVYRRLNWQCAQPDDVRKLSGVHKRSRSLDGNYWVLHATYDECVSFSFGKETNTYRIKTESGILIVHDLQVLDLRQLSPTVDFIVYTNHPDNCSRVTDFVGGRAKCNVCGGKGYVAAAYCVNDCAECNSRLIPFIDYAGNRVTADWGDVIIRYPDGLHLVSDDDALPG